MAAPDGHAYISTACHHDIHERCRKRCKFCLTPCQCQCHAVTRLVDLPSSALTGLV